MLRKEKENCKGKSSDLIKSSASCVLKYFHLKLWYTTELQMVHLWLLTFKDHNFRLEEGDKKKVMRVRSTCLFCPCCWFGKFSWRLQGYWVLCAGCPPYLRFEVQAVRALHNQVILELQNIKINAKNRVNLSFKNSAYSRMKQPWKRSSFMCFFFLNMAINGLVCKFEVFW